MTLQQNFTLQGGKYRIIKVLGQGGFGITYLAEHDLMGKSVAIKEFFMKDFCNRDESTSHVTIGTEGGREQVVRFKEKFLKEARNIARLHHPNIIRISDVFEENGTAYYVMDYCENGSLESLMKSYPDGLYESAIMKYIRQVASALQFIHEQNMNHLDIKPANIMLDARDNAILIDFGLSKQYDVTGVQTSTTPVGISHGYAPIEQYRPGGVSSFSPQVDIYSLGATLYKLASGKTPPEAHYLLDESLPAFSASQNIVNAVGYAMKYRSADRTQTVKGWLNILDVQASVPDDADEGTIMIDPIEAVENKNEDSVGNNRENFDKLQDPQTIIWLVLSFVFFFTSIIGLFIGTIIIYNSYKSVRSYKQHDYNSWQYYAGRVKKISRFNVIVNGILLAFILIYGYINIHK